MSSSVGLGNTTSIAVYYMDSMVNEMLNGQQERNNPHSAIYQEGNVIWLNAVYASKLQ